MRHSSVDLGELARAVAQALARQAPDRQVESVIAPGLVAEGDPALVRVLLENLLANAWKYTGKNPRARIEVGRQGAEGREEFFVRDNGAGFDPAYAAKLFQPFQRLHRPDEFEGHGIGLATVLRIVHRHGGDVRAEGAVGRGATFYFTLSPTRKDEG
jgi:light-regulated signal transduction histidine kinase (bacteriophytochrome)